MARAEARTWRPFLWCAGCPAHHATYPNGRSGPIRGSAWSAPRRAPLPMPVPFLFGLAPGGVCRAAAVAGSAVRSYRTVSPLPRLIHYAPRRS